MYRADSTVRSLDALAAAGPRPAAPPDAVPRTDVERVGDILVRNGALDAGGATRVAAHQVDSRQLFGEAAVALRLVDERAVARALAEQADIVVADAAALATLSPELVVAHDPFGAQSESVRGLRTRILLESAAPAGPGRARVVAVVGSGAGEGRSWLAANLAISFAHRGRRTVLVDADLRASRQHRLFGELGRVGLAGWLAGRSAEPDLKPVAAVRHLWLMAAGSRPANPQELLSGERFAQTIARLAEDADTVVLDTPAAAGAADYAYAAMAADVVLLVVRRDRSRVRAVRELAEQLERLGRRPAGIVVNDKR